MLAPDGGGYDPGRASHAVLLELRRSLEQHPGVYGARGDPVTRFTVVRADVNPHAFGADAEEGTLTVRWYEGDTPEDSPEFVFHYSDRSGCDCGWHREPNPHVDGWSHYQERHSPEDEYEYERVSFGRDTPTGMLWEVLDRLEGRLSEERFTD